MKEYEFTALIEVGLIVEAENENEAKKKIDKYSAEGWVRNGEIIGFSDVDFINVSEVKS